MPLFVWLACDGGGGVWNPASPLGQGGSPSPFRPRGGAGGPSPATEAPTATPLLARNHRSGSSWESGAPPRSAPPPLATGFRAPGRRWQGLPRSPPGLRCPLYRWRPRGEAVSDSGRHPSATRADVGFPECPAPAESGRARGPHPHQPLGAPSEGLNSQAFAGMARCHREDLGPEPHS
ncbi:skin secretory protein xP2-like [Prionailurus viverrinus]|uniref:skin secretory protein xP2-like n=1 Tax=Prionailurus viverrinus TaxID=61388 RepID=UPI001FF38618|nr:skin secretory protein xP2-like [Prionailurus viverrinus]